MNNPNDFRALGMQKREEDIKALLDIPQSEAIPVPTIPIANTADVDREEKKTVSESRMFCFHCGAPTAKGMAFCPYCGQKLEIPAPQPQKQFAPVTAVSATPVIPAVTPIIPAETPATPVAPATSSSASAPVPPKPFYTPPAAPRQAPPTPTAPQRVPCPGCGLAVPPSVSFCPRCGKDFRQPTQQKPRKSIKSNKLLWIILSVCLGLALIIGLVLFLILKPPAVEKVTFTKSEIVLYVGDTEKPVYSVLPREAGWERQATFTTSDNAVATVSENGTITAQGKGTCTITVKCGNKRDTIAVTVKKGVDFEKMFNDYCTDRWAEVGSDNSYLQIDTNPSDYTDAHASAADSAIKNVNKAIGLPDSLYNDMRNTSYDMGTQTEKFENIGISVSWKYHPNIGLEVTYKLID